MYLSKNFFIPFSIIKGYKKKIHPLYMKVYPLSKCLLKGGEGILEKKGGFMLNHPFEW
jgi:hypothetical protein